jgi:hypothetical protein
LALNLGRISTVERQKKGTPAVGRRRAKKSDADAVLQSANGYIVQHYPFGCLGTKPQRLLGESDFWIVPVFLTSPGHGAVGEVGLIAVDAHTHHVVGATRRQEVSRAIKHLKESKRDELEAAFHRARTV